MKKRKDGRYQKKVTLPDGRQKMVYGKSQGEIKQKAQDLLQEYQSGLVIGDDTTVGEWTVQWFATYKGNLRKVTRENYAILYNKHILPRLGPLPLREVRPAHCQGVMAEVANASESLQRKVLVIMRQIFGTARQNRLILFDPTEGLTITKRISESKTKYLSPEQQRQLMNAVTDPRARAFCGLCLYAGLRREEALGLQWGDIDTLIHVRRAVTFVGNDPDPDLSLKTKSSYRDVPILSELQPILDATPRTSLFVIPTATGQIMTKSAFRRMWYKVEQAVDFRVTPHMLRHSFATNLHGAKIDLKTAQHIMGHSSIAVTANIYTHIQNGETEKAMTKVQKFISSSQKVVKSKKKA